MFYVIDAVRWGPEGRISHVQWHGVEAEGETIVHARPQVVPVIDAADQCDANEVRVYVGGETGQFFRMRACSEGLEAEPDGKATPLRERLAHLPSF